MKCLVAYDASEGATAGLTLVAGIEWPSDSSVRIVSVIEPIVAPIGGPLNRSGAVSPEIDAAVTDYVNASNREAVARLAGRVAVDGKIVRGRAATALSDEAKSYDADLIVVGSRGRGGIASLVLGSVSSELVDEAPCPVLVARHPTISRVLFATDGSPAAAAAENALARWPLFANVPIHVLSVAQTALPWMVGLTPMVNAPAAMELYSSQLEALRADYERMAEGAAERLRATGRTVDWVVRGGVPATEIVAAVDELRADLVVLGSRGLTGLPRVLLGSVARNVLHGAKSSVLVVRETHT